MPDVLAVKLEHAASRAAPTGRDARRRPRHRVARRATGANRGAAHRGGAASAATFASRAGISCAGELATQPASGRPAAADRRGGEQRVVEAAEPHADDQDHRPAEQGRARSAMVSRSLSGTSQPPAPSARRRSCATRAAPGSAAASAAASRRHPVPAAARCGAIAGCNATGLTCLYSIRTVALACSRSASSFTHAPSRHSQPAARGLMPRVRRPRHSPRAAARRRRASCPRPCRCR